MSLRETLLLEFNTKLDQLKTAADLATLRTEFLGKNGKLTAELKNLSNLPVSERGPVGKELNELKIELNTSLQKKEAALSQEEGNKQDAASWFDVSIPQATHFGSLHPISKVQNNIEDVFSAMGFTILDGPHIESDYYNFQALNFPPDHPARDAQDTFYLEGGSVLRTQTSAMQIRAMETMKPPIKVVCPGKVFRAERIDASHSSVFHQVEGLVVAPDISLANMIHFLKIMLSEVYEREIKIRLRPGYFPFVEPGLEIDIVCFFCSGKGCSVCKNQGWIEILGCGLVHPNVLKYGGLDSNKYSGFAFGMGMDRFAMLKYGINDIRLLHGADPERIEQFSKL